MLKLCIVFAVIVLLIWMRRPLFIAISGGLAAAVICYRMRLELSGEARWRRRRSPWR